MLRFASVIDLFIRYPEFRGIYVRVDSEVRQSSEGNVYGPFGFVLGSCFYDLSHGELGRGLERVEILVCAFNMAAALSASKEEVLMNELVDSGAIGEDIDSFTFDQLTPKLQDIVRQLVEGGWFDAAGEWHHGLGINGHDGYDSLAYEGMFVLEDFAQ